MMTGERSRDMGPAFELMLVSFNVSFCTYVGATFDASTTNLTYQIPAPVSANDTLPFQEPLEVVISFLSPITPTSTLRQSIPASYVTVHVSGGFDIDIYIDINGQWASGDRASNIVWEFGEQHLAKGHGLKTWKIRRQTELLLSEIRDRAEWGTLHFSAPWDVRHESGTSGLLRPRFARTGTLQNAIDDDYRGIMEEEPVFAFAKSFRMGNTSTTANIESVMFTIAHIQDPVVQFAAARGLTFMRPLWASWFPTVEKLLEFHYLDFGNAASLARNYSAQLAKDANESGSTEYADIVALTARQVIGATSFSGSPGNPILFIKEISSNGNFQTIDVIYPAFPFFLYTNPRWLAYMLEPLIEHTLSGQYPNSYAMHDLGAHFPNATGHPDGQDEYMPVEECGNILIMGLAIVNSLKYETDAASSAWADAGSQSFDDNPEASAFSLSQLEIRDGVFGLDDSWGGGAKGVKQAQKWVNRSYKLWKQWTGYLVEFSLEPENQLSTDDFAGPLQLQTNLALKGIIGIKAMSGIAAVVENVADTAHFMNISETFVDKWVEFGMSRDGSHAKLSYDWYGSWTTLYNLFADALLCFHLEGTSITSGIVDAPIPLSKAQIPLGHHHHDPKTPPRTGFVPHKIYSLQSDWYHSVRQRYGLPLDSRHLYTKTDWEFFAIAVASKSVRAEILTSVAKWVNETTTDRPLTDLHDTEGTGHFLGAYFMARPVIGGHFAFLALGKACGGKAIEGLGFLEEEQAYHDLGDEEL